MAFTEQDRNRIMRALTTKRLNPTCAMCRTTSDWILAEDYAPIGLRSPALFGVIGGGFQTIPTITLVCKNCGYIIQFASKVLAELPPDASPARAVSPPLPPGVSQ